MLPCCRSISCWCVLSGTASYAGIQLLNSRFHVQLLPAKLLVETLLFFANFAIQRDFIFGKSAEASSRAGRWIDRSPVLGSAGGAGGSRHRAGGDSRVWFRPRTDVGECGLDTDRPVSPDSLHLDFLDASMVIVLIVPAAFAAIVALLVAVATAMRSDRWRCWRWQPF